MFTEHVERICVNCKHWSGKETDAEGLCQRFPPQVILMPVRTLAGDGIAPMGHFPVTRKDIWCGEFAAQTPNVT